MLSASYHSLLRWQEWLPGHSNHHSSASPRREFQTRPAQSLCEGALPCRASKALVFYLVIVHWWILNRLWHCGPFFENKGPAYQQLYGDGAGDHLPLIYRRRFCSSHQADPKVTISSFIYIILFTPSPGCLEYCCNLKSFFVSLKERLCF